MYVRGNLTVQPELQASSWGFGSKPGNCAAKQKRAGLTEQPSPSSPASYSLLLFNSCSASQHKSLSVEPITRSPSFDLIRAHIGLKTSHHPTQSAPHGSLFDVPPVWAKHTHRTTRVPRVPNPGEAQSCCSPTTRPEEIVRVVHRSNIILVGILDDRRSGRLDRV